MARLLTSTVSGPPPAPRHAQLWIPLGQGNANFFYAMNLAWGLWQVVALLSTLRATAQLDRRRTAAQRAKQE